MEYQKIVNWLDNTSDQLSKSRTKNRIEINDQWRGVYSTGNDIRFKTTMLKSSLYDYSDAYILLKGKIKITGAEDDAATRQAEEKNKGVRLKNWAPFVSCKSGINNREIDNAKDFDIVMLMYNLRENFWKTIEISLLNCEVYLILTRSSTCAITNSTGATRFAITDTKPYVPLVLLSIQDYTNLLQQLK